MNTDNSLMGQFVTQYITCFADILLAGSLINNGDLVESKVPKFR